LSTERAEMENPPDPCSSGDIFYWRLKGYLPGREKEQSDKVLSTSHTRRAEHGGGGVGRPRSACIQRGDKGSKGGTSRMAANNSGGQSHRERRSGKRKTWGGGPLSKQTQIAGGKVIKIRDQKKDARGSR